MDYGLCLTGILSPDTGAFKVRAPHRAQLVDIVSVNLSQGREITVVQISTIGKPVIGWQFQQGVCIRSDLGKFRRLRKRKAKRYQQQQKHRL